MIAAGVGMMDPVEGIMGDVKRQHSGGNQILGTRGDRFRVQVEQLTFDRQRDPSSGRKRGYRQKQVGFWNLT